MPEGTVVGEFEKYTDAVDCVDSLIRHDFPATSIAIIGAGLKSVEQVRARMNYGRAALRGLVQGSWLGLLYWIFFGVNSSTVNSNDLNAVMTDAQQSIGPAIVIGMGIGMLWQILRFSMVRRQREFLSTTAFVAATYEVTVPNQMFNLAQQKLNEHANQCLEKH